MFGKELEMLIFSQAFKGQNDVSSYDHVRKTEKSSVKEDERKILNTIYNICCIFLLISCMVVVQ